MLPGLLFATSLCTSAKRSASLLLMSLNQSLRALSYAVTSFDGTLPVTTIRLCWSGNIVRNITNASRTRTVVPFPCLVATDIASATLSLSY